MLAKSDVDYYLLAAKPTAAKHPAANCRVPAFVSLL